MGKTMEVNKLLVSWKSPISKSNYFVGVLEKEKGIYRFKYNKNIVEEAKKEGFTLFIGLNDLNKIYESSKLFSVFERRLPNKNRNIFKKVVQEYQLENSDDLNWDYLRITKGRLATDSLSFLEPIIIFNDSIHYEGEIAGWSFTKDNNRLFSIGDSLELHIDLANEKDSKAVEVLDPENHFVRVGFIAKPFNEVFFHLLNIGYKIEARVVSLDEDSKRPTLKINTKIKSEDIKGCRCEFLVSVI